MEKKPPKSDFFVSLHFYLCGKGLVNYQEIYTMYLLYKFIEYFFYVKLHRNP